jgi:hypothetical protein
MTDFQNAFYSMNEEENENLMGTEEDEDPFRNYCP